MLTEEQASFYEEKGYLVVDGVLSDVDLNLIQGSVTNMLDAIIERAKKEYPGQQALLENADNISAKMTSDEFFDEVMLGTQ